MSKTKPKTEKGSEERVTGRLCRHQSKSSNFISKKQNPVGRCKDIKNDIFDLFLKGHIELFSKSLKSFYYIFGINLQNNVSGMQYSVKNISKPTMSAPTEPAFSLGETPLTVVQKGIMDAKIKIR